MLLGTGVKSAPTGHSPTRAARHVPTATKPLAMSASLAKLEQPPASTAALASTPTKPPTPARSARSTPTVWGASTSAPPALPEQTTPWPQRVARRAPPEPFQPEPRVTSARRASTESSEPHPALIVRKDGTQRQARPSVSNA